MAHVLPPRRLAAAREISPVVRPADVARSSAIRVLIADGQALVRAGLRLLLEADDHISVVGEAASGEEAVALSARLSPDVALIDAMLPGLDAVETTAQIVGESGLAVMLLTASDDDDQQIFAALRAGARALLPKSMQPTQLVHAIDALARGEALLSPGLTRRVLDELTARAEPVSPKPGVVDELTPRDREVARLVGLGLRNDEI